VPLLNLFVVHQVAETLIKNKANIEAAGPDGQTSLHKAVVGNHVELVESLIRHGSIKNVRDKAGRLPSELAEKMHYAHLVVKVR